MKIALYRDQFADYDREIYRDEEFAVFSFRFRTGVEALRFENSAGEATMLPFQGQQVWHCAMFGRTQHMRMPIQVPVPNVDFLETYGGFLLHCGFTAMGGPGPEDDHALHGELPNALYDEAWLTGGADENGRFIGLAGRYEYARAFGAHYVATPEVRLYPRSGALRIAFEAQNLSRSAMEYMYLCHVNFRPVDNSVLIDTTTHDTEHVRVRDNIPSHLSVSDEYRAFLASLRDDPAKHERLSPDLPFNPEAVLFLSLDTDNEGWAHSMQKLPTGEADFISFRPSELDHAIRWISRTPDQDGLGLILPATAEPDGYSAEKAKGNIKMLPAGERFRCEFYTGALTAPAAQRYSEHIEKSLSKAANRIDPVRLDAESH